MSVDEGQEGACYEQQAHPLIRGRVRWCLLAAGHEGPHDFRD